MALAIRSVPVLWMAVSLLGGCGMFGAREADPHALMQAQPGESWLYAYSNDTGSKTATLLMIDPTSGDAHPIGAPIQGQIDALAFDPTHRVLYGAWQTGNGPNAASELVTVDWYTGDVTFVGPLTASHGGTPATAKVEGMDVAPDGRLLAFTHSPQRLVEVDPSNALFQWVGDLNFALHSYGATFLDETLYAVNAAPNHLQVFEVDPSNGQGVRHLHEQPGGFSVGAATDGAGTLYTVFGNELYTLDTNTFQRTLVGDTGWTGLGSLAWIHESEAGMALEDACPCEADWKNHGEYVSCVAHWANEYAADEEEHGAIVSEAARSDCGHNRP